MRPVTADEFAQWRRQDSFSDLADGKTHRIASGSPRIRLSLDAASFGIREGSPPHAQLATPTCSVPGEQIPPLIGPLAAVLQRCVNLNAAASAEAAVASAWAGTAPVGRTSGLTPGSQQQPAEQQATQNESRQRLRRAPPGGKKTEFHGARQPPISIHDYLRRIAKYAKCSPVCFVMAHTYIERLAQADPTLTPEPLNVHRMLTVGTMLAAKLMDDRYFNNAYYAKIGGVGLAELNALELKMMARLQYSLRVSGAEVSATLARLTRGEALSDADFAAAFPSLLVPAAVNQIVGRAAVKQHAPPRQLTATGPTTSGSLSRGGGTPAVSLPPPAAPRAPIATALATVSTREVSPATAASLPLPATALIQAAKLTGSASAPGPLELQVSTLKPAHGDQVLPPATVPIEAGTKQTGARQESAKVLTVRFSDEQHGGTTALTAAALSAASLAEESDSSRWRACIRSNSVASIGSSGGSSCHRAAIDITIPSSGSISAC